MRLDLPPGYRMRAASRDDIPALVAVVRACDLEDIGEIDVFEDWVHDEWLRPRFDPSTDAWIVTGQGGEVVAAAYTWDEEPRTVFDSAGVDRDNAFGATRLYERAGMRRRRRWLVVAKTLAAAPDPPS